MIAGLKPYPEMKDSGVKWLGAVPAQWEVHRLRSVADMRVSNVDKHTREGEQPVRLCNYVDVYKNDQIQSGMNFMPATATGEEIERFRLRSGDVLITKDSEAWNDIGVPALVREVEDDVVSGYHLALLRSRASRVHGDYLFRVIQSQPTAYQFHVRANGVTRYGLSHEAIKSIRIPVPSNGEQSAIARFLDQTERRMVQHIRAKQKLIGLVEEQKKTIIQQAVTGQIDVRTGQPYGAYRPAGLVGVSEIPKHWEQCRLRNVVSVVTTGSRGWSSYAADTGPLFIRVANLNRGSIQLRFDDVVRLDLPNTTEAARSRIRAGDLLVSVTAYIGSVGVAADGLEEAYVSQHVARCQPRPGQSGRWLAYGLLSELGQSHGQLSLYGGTKDGLSLDDVKNFPILVPPAREQEEIVRWIDDKLASVAKVKGSAQREIAVMGEYRARLVADVVTGKLDVRQAAGTLPVTHTSDDPRGTHREDE